jgi:DNA-binding transcriptional LysR family regulator
MLAVPLVFAARGITRRAHRWAILSLAFTRCFPPLHLRVEVGNTEAMAFAVKAGRVSLALVEGPLVDDELDVEPYEPVFILPPVHAFAIRKKPIHASELANVPFVFREEGSGTRLQVERILLDAGVRPKVALTLPNGFLATVMPTPKKAGARQRAEI